MKPDILVNITFCCCCCFRVRTPNKEREVNIFKNLEIKILIRFCVFSFILYFIPFLSVCINMWIKLHVNTSCCSWILQKKNKQVFWILLIASWTISLFSREMPINNRYFNDITFILLNIVISPLVHGHKKERMNEWMCCVFFLHLLHIYYEIKNFSSINAFIWDYRAKKQLIWNKNPWSSNEHFRSCTAHRVSTKLT